MHTRIPRLAVLDHNVSIESCDIYLLMLHFEHFVVCPCVSESRIMDFESTLLTSTCNYTFTVLSRIRIMLCGIMQNQAKSLVAASFSASKIWPLPGLGLQQKNHQPRRDGPICLHFTLPTTGHHN